jgi:hypothetical protein
MRCGSVVDGKQVEVLKEEQEEGGRAFSKLSRGESLAEELPSFQRSRGWQPSV